MRLSSTGAIPAGTGNISINFGGTVAGGYSTIGGWLNSSKLVANSAGVLALTGTDAETVSMATLPSLVIGAAGTATFSGSLTPAGSVYCLGGGGGVLTFSPAITGGNSLAAFGGGSGGALILTGGNSYTGATTIGSGGTLEFSSAANETLSGNISGGGALVIAGPGALTLGGSASNYTGGTTVSAGVLQIGDGSTTRGSLPGNVIISGTTPGALTFDTPVGMSVACSGNISGGGSGGLAMIGTGVAVLSGSNSYTGPTTIGGGTLEFSNAASETLGGNISGGGALVMAGPGALTLAGSNSCTGATTISGGVLALSSTSAIPPGTGNITINSGGALAVTGAYSTINGWMNSNKIAVSSAGVLALTGTDSETVTMASFPNLFIGSAGTATFSGSLTPAGSVYCLGGGGGVLTFSPAITGGNSLSAFGSGSVGTLILSGSNSYTGGTTIGGGVLAFSNTGAVPPGTGNITINSGGALAVTFAYGTIGGWLNKIAASSAGVLAFTGTDSETISMASFSSLFIGSTGTATFSGSLTPAGSTYRLGGGGGVLTFSTAITGGNSLAAFGGGSGGALILTGGNSYTGATTIGSGGTLEFSSVANETLSGNISGGGALVIAGPGTLTLAGSNSCTGATTISGGVLALSSTSSIPPGTGNITINSGGALAGGYSTIGGWMSSNRIAASSAGVLALTGTDAETVSMASLPNLGVGAAGAATFSGSLTPASCAYNLGGGGGVLTFSTAITGVNSLAAFGGGSGGTLILTGNNSYAGATTIASGGTLEFNAASEYLSGNISGGGALATACPGTFTIAGVASYTGATALLGGTLQFTNTANQTLSGNISGGGALATACPGTFTIAGVASYTGATALSAARCNSPTPRTRPSAATSAAAAAWFRQGRAR